MRKLSAPRGCGERVGVLAFEVASLMSRAASLWRALGDAQVARLRGEAIRLEGVRRLVADDDAALLALALAEMADACRGLSRAVARLSARCADPLLRRFAALFAALVAAGADPHGLRYAAPGKMDRKARKMQRLVAATALLCQELDVLAELEQGLRRRRAGGGGETPRRVARQRQEVDALRAASLWNRTFDYAVRLLARSLFTVVARIIEVFRLEPKTLAMDGGGDDDATVSFTSTRLSWSNSFAGSMSSSVFPSDFTKDTARKFFAAKSTKINGDVRRFLLSRSGRSLWQLKWPSAGNHLMGCVVAAGSNSPDRERRLHGSHHHEPPLSFSYVSADNDDHGSVDRHSQEDHPTSTRLSTSVFESSHNTLTSEPAATLGAAALAVHYANLIILVEKLAASPRQICPDERDALYGMLTGSIRASLRARLKPPAAKKKKKTTTTTTTAIDPVLAAEWGDTVRRILAWLAPLAHNMVRCQSERNFEQRNVASSCTGVLLLQTLHFADRKKTEAAVTELLVGLDCIWRCERDAKIATGNYNGLCRLT